ncbi:MAG: class I SAM-dependent methyltransferase [Peptococcaceae bacterium]|jgi:SAM-dependent methyltransferase|nr:class I SAM-dependent methyltransferase [Peptococcaceae bacterium]
MLCRICGGKLTKQLGLDNVPKAAQWFPLTREESVSSGCSLDIHLCTDCGLVQHIGETVPYYRDVIRATAYSQEMRQFRADQLADFVDKYSLSGKTALEVGCGKGEYLELIKEAGLNAVGIESNSYNAGRCHELGFNVARGYLAELTELNTLPICDVFFSFNYFEHLPDLRLVLRKLRMLLTPNAIGVVEVPNFDMIIRENMLSELIPDHLYYFTKETLENVLRMNGFAVEDCNAIWHDYILSAVVRPRQPPDLMCLSQFRNNLNASFRAFTDKLAGKHLAIWGAGHQSLTALALCDKDIVNRYSFIVDSAPFKQNRFAPVTALPIVSPDVFHNSPIDAVLVIAAAYSNEIAASVRAASNGITIGILRNTEIDLV